MNVFLRYTPRVCELIFFFFIRQVVYRIYKLRLTRRARKKTLVSGACTRMYLYIWGEEKNVHILETYYNKYYLLIIWESDFRDQPALEHTNNIVPIYVQRRYSYIIPAVQGADVAAAAVHYIIILYYTQVSGYSIHNTHIGIQQVYARTTTRPILIA